jgi:hypothetical protein
MALYQSTITHKYNHGVWHNYQTNRLEFITKLMHNFIYSIIILHHDPQHVSSIAVWSSPLLISALYGSIQSGTIPETVNIQLSS